MQSRCFIDFFCCIPFQSGLIAIPFGLYWICSVRVILDKFETHVGVSNDNEVLRSSGCKLNSIHHRQWHPTTKHYI